MPDIEHVRVPDEILFAIDSICERWPKIASKENGGVTLRNLKPQEKVALDVLPLFRLVDEIIDNINFVMSDLNQLAEDSRAFGDRHPFKRYKLLARTFFYEFGRFEDAFGYYTLWFQKRGYIDKKARRELMDDFYAQIEHIVKIRNLCLHENPDWSKSTTPEISLLDGLDLFAVEVTHKETGEALKWEPHLGPLCLEMETSFYQATAHMRTTWNMFAVRTVETLIGEGKLKKARRRFAPKNLTENGTRISALDMAVRDLSRAVSNLKRHRDT